MDYFAPCLFIGPESDHCPVKSDLGLSPTNTVFFLTPSLNCVRLNIFDLKYTLFSHMNNSLPCHHCGLKSTRRGLCGDRDGASQEFFGSTGHRTYISGSTDRYQRIAIKTAENRGKTCDLRRELQTLINSNTGHPTWLLVFSNVSCMKN